MANYKQQKDFDNLKKLDELSKQLPQFLGIMFKYMGNANKSTGTILGYAQDLKLFFDYLQDTPGFKEINLLSSTADILDNLTSEDIFEYLDATMSPKEYIDSRGKKHLKAYSQNTRARRLSSIKTMYRFYSGQKIIKTDLSSQLPSPKIKDTNIRALDSFDVQRILNAITDTSNMSQLDLSRHAKVELRDIAIISTLFGTGIRVSELVGLDMKSIDYDKNILRTVRKGGNEDEIYFPDNVKEALLEYISKTRPLLEPEDDIALFISTHHKRITVRAVENLVKKYAMKAGIADADKITPHKARSTYGTHLYNQSGDIYLVADALGHKSVETTRKHYAKISTEHKKKAADISSGLFSNKNN